MAEGIPMSISFEGKLGILLGLLSMAGAGAIMIAPERLWIGWTMIAAAGVGGVGLGFYHYGRKFSVVLVAACVLWIDYLYYTNVLGFSLAPQAQPAPPVSSPSPSPTPAKPKLASTLARMILSCDSPKPAKLPSLAKRKAELAERLELAQKLFGVPITGDVTENELTMSLIVNHPTGSIKQSWFVTRVDDKILISITNELVENNALSFIFALASLAPLDPNEDTAKQTQEKVADFVKVTPDKCKFL
jgi:hypothetical protein